jgi:hypothetical protein
MSEGIARQLRGAAQEGPAALRLSLGELLQLHGQDSGAALLMLMALLCTLPVAGVGTVLSLGIFALAWAWLRGRDSVNLPARLGGLTLNATWTRRSLHSLAWTYERAERWLRPRWPALCHARTRAGWAVWIALMGALIFLPLPLGNVLPGTSLMLLSLGWLFRDGLALLLAAATGMAGVGYAIAMGHLAIAAWQHMGAALGL